MTTAWDIADKADMIINGFAFLRTPVYIKAVNLEHPEEVAIIDDDGEIIETTMDDIEITVVEEYYRRNRRYMEE